MSLNKNLFDFILWDNDGVLVDTEKLYFEAYKQALAEKGFVLTHELFYEHILKQSNGIWHLLPSISKKEELIIRQRRDDFYAQKIESNDLLIEGVTEALHQLNEKLRMGIVTSSKREHFDLIHKRLHIVHYFEFVLTAEDYDHYKPAPDPYLKGVEIANVPKKRCLVIEDSERGLMAAKAAGLQCWVIPRGLTMDGNFSMADRIFESIDELMDQLCL